MSDIMSRFSQEEETISTSEKYLTFFLDNQNYAVPIVNVIEIISLQEITEMPNFPEYVKGIINVRGTIIPLIDIRVRFKRKEKAYDDRSSIIITLINELQIGLIVDLVDEVIDIDEQDISPAPRMNFDTSEKYVAGVGKVQDKIILILDTDRLLNDQELSGIAEII